MKKNTFFRENTIAAQVTIIIFWIPSPKKVKVNSPADGPNFPG